jgi:hypothetical protein
MIPYRSAFFATLRLLSGLSVAFFAGCSASSHQRVPLPAQDVTVTRPDLARVYLIRDDANVLHGGAILVYDGDLEIGALSKGTFLCWERAGGRTLGRAFYDAVDPSKGHVEGVVDLDCPAGRAYYFKVMIDREGGKPVVVPLAPEEGRSLVAERRPANQG